MQYQLLSKFFLVFVMFFFISGCSDKSSTIVYSNSANVHKATMKPYTVLGKTYYPTMVNVGDTYSGIASWYGKDFHGKKTANGEIYNMNALTAAHKTLPMNTIVKVTNINNGKSITVRINDRGPFVASRIIDLSREGASKLDIIKTGTAPVKLEIISFDNVVSTISSDVLMAKKSVVLSGFDVQIGSFRNFSGAELTRDEHNKLNGRYKAIVKKGYYENDVIYRVWLQGFGSEEEARDFIATGQYEGAFIVRE